ncbi:hypothetical protein RSOL_386410, partial [Rhizoctonia solani AG-3 Rhs1AP]
MEDVQPKRFIQKPVNTEQGRSKKLAPKQAGEGLIQEPDLGSSNEMCTGTGENFYKPPLVYSLDGIRMNASPIRAWSREQRSS